VTTRASGTAGTISQRHGASRKGRLGMTKSQDREGLEVYHGATRNGASVQLDEAGSWRHRLAREAADALGDVDFWVVRLGGGASERVAVRRLSWSRLGGCECRVYVHGGGEGGVRTASRRSTSPGRVGRRRRRRRRSSRRKTRSRRSSGSSSGSGSKTWCAWPIGDARTSAASWFSRASGQRD